MLISWLPEYHPNQRPWHSRWRRCFKIRGRIRGLAPNRPPPEHTPSMLGPRPSKTDRLLNTRFKTICTVSASGRCRLLSVTMVHGKLLYNSYFRQLQDMSMENVLWLAFVSRLGCSPVSLMLPGECREYDSQGLFNNCSESKQQRPHAKIFQSVGS